MTIMTINQAMKQRINLINVKTKKAVSSNNDQVIETTKRKHELANQRSAFPRQVAEKKSWSLF